MGVSVPVAALGVGLCAAAAVAIYFLFRRKRSPEEKERRRRLDISVQGRLIEGLVIEIRESSVIYKYSWQGIDYETSQDLATMSAMLPRAIESLIGPVTVKFLPRDPYNSIVLCERWSGFPKTKIRLDVEGQQT